MSDTPNPAGTPALAAPSPAPSAPGAATAAPAAPPTFETSPGEAIFGVKARVADPERDPSGRPSSMPTADSVAAELAARKDAPAGTEAPPTGQPAADPAAEPAPGAKARHAFAGYEAEGDTPEAAAKAVEHKILTMKGSFKSVVEKYKAAEANYTQATQVASAWEKIARQLGYTDEGGVPAARPADPNSAPAPKPGAPTSPAAAAPSASTEIDWKTYQDILTDKEGGPALAQFFLAQEQDRVVEARVNAAMDKVEAKLRGELEPVLQTHAQSGTLTATDTRIAKLKTYEDPRTGKPAYPELADVKALEGIGQIFVAMGVNPEDIHKASDIQWHQAILAYRFNTTGTVTAPVPPTVPPAAAPAPDPEGDAAAAAALAGVHAPLLRPNPPNGAAFTPPARHPIFGVSPR